MPGLFRRLFGKSSSPSPPTAHSPDLSPELLAQRDELVKMAERMKGFYFGYGDSLRAQGDLEGALSDYKAKLDLIETLELRDPNEFDKQAATQDMRRIVLQRLGHVLQEMGRFEEAANYYSTACHILDQLSARSEDLHVWTELARAIESHAFILFQSGARTVATQRFAQAVQAYDRTIERFPDDSEAKELSIMSRMYLGKGLGREGIKHLEQAIDVIETLDRLGKLDPRRREWTAMIRTTIDEMRR